MASIKFRLGKPSDAKQITDLHYKVRDSYSTGYFSQMGKLFLKEYYKIVLNDPWELFVVAVDSENDNIQGFCSASLDVVKQFELMRRHKIRMGLAALPTFICKPQLIAETLKRYKATKGQSEEKYIPKTGARCEYWTWDYDNKDSASSVALFNLYLEILYKLGVESLPLDVDHVNKKVLAFHKLNKAVVDEQITLSDGRDRSLLHYNLKQRFAKK
jgi:hypothetical protein